MKDFNWEDIAESAYKAYSYSINYKMRNWSDLPLENKIAWQAAVQQISMYLDAISHPNNQYDLDESKWKDWKPGLGWYGEQLIDESTSD